MAKADLIPFKKGVDPRRNLKGRPEGAKGLTTLLREALEVIGEGNKDPYAVLLVKKVMKMAIVDGNEQMIKLCYNYLEGMPKQDVRVDGKLTVVEMAQEIIKKNAINPSTINNRK